MHHTLRAIHGFDRIRGDYSFLMVVNRCRLLACSLAHALAHLHSHSSALTPPSLSPITHCSTSFFFQRCTLSFNAGTLPTRITFRHTTVNTNTRYRASIGAHLSRGTVRNTTRTLCTSSLSARATENRASFARAPTDPIAARQTHSREPNDIVATNSRSSRPPINEPYTRHGFATFTRH